MPECIYKNRNKLKDELLFLKKYFEHGKLKVNFSKEKIKKIIEQFEELVQSYKIQNGIKDDYNELNIEEIGIEEKKDKEIKEDESEDDDGFNLLKINDDEEKKINQLNDINEISNKCLNTILL